MERSRLSRYWKLQQVAAALLLLATVTGVVVSLGADKNGQAVFFAVCALIVIACAAVGRKFTRAF